MSKKRKKNNWKIPQNAHKFFDPHYDDNFKAKHPVLYFLTIIAIIVLVIIGPTLYVFLCSLIQSTFNENIGELLIWIIGLIASSGISIGLSNLFMIVHNQYLGHYVTLISFAIGIAVPSLALYLLWLI